MKYRIISVLTAIFLLITAFFATMISGDNPNKRVHQHLSARQPDAGCSCDKTELCTHLPLVLIDTNGQAVPGEPITDDSGAEIGFTKTDAGEDMLEAKISIISDETRNHHPSDAADLESSMRIRIRGNSSRFFEKKGYLIRFTKEDGTYQNKEVMGMDSHYEWALHGPYLDKTLIRNYMWYNIAGELMSYAPNVRFCEVIVNGEYQGIYVMTETITNGEDCRIDVSEPIKGTTKSGYLLRLDRGSTNLLKNIETFTNYSYRNRQKFDIQYPRSGDLTPELVEGISQDFSDFEKSLYSYDYDTDDYGYYYDINVQSFVDYFIINEFTANYDAGWLSTYVYRDIGEKYNMVVWDFNSACDNYNNPMTSPQHFEMQHVVWFYMMMKDEYFTQHLIDRYRELRKNYLSDAYLNTYIDETIAYLGDAVDRNFSVWGHTFEKNMIDPPERNPRSHEQAVQQMKTFIKERGEWMDENIEVLKQYSHESKNKKFNH